MAMAKLNVEQKINQNLLTFICSMLLVVAGWYVKVGCDIYYILCYLVSAFSMVSIFIILAVYTMNYCARKLNK